MATAEKAVVTIVYDDGSQNTATMNLAGPAPTNALTIQIDDTHAFTAVVGHTPTLRTYDPSQPVAVDDQDPGNTDPEKLTAALDPNDDVFATLNEDTK